jgi:nucleotide-binding universal stress UspA family protein
MVFHKILVPYDDSKASDKAFSYALKLAKMSSESEKIHKQGDVVVTIIILLHILEEIPVPPSFGGTTLTKLSKKTGETITFREYLDEVYQEMKASAIKMLDQRTREHTLDITDLEIKPKVTIGVPADEIMEMANEENVDLIIMGNVGLSRFSKLKALGSVSRNVSERAKCPVMLVR